ncbi:FMN reductase (NADH) RutF [compost metagenome]
MSPPTLAAAAVPQFAGVIDFARPADREALGRDFKASMRRLAAGVCVITTVEEGRLLGCTATAVTSVSADPPTLLVCLNQSSRTHAAVIRAGFFGVSVLSGSDEQIARDFAGMNAVPDRFWDDGWTTLHSGAPVLSNRAAAFDCRVSTSTSVASHTVIFGEVVASRQQAGSLLVYAGARFIQVPAQ